jgi:hypothetical protein
LKLFVANLPAGSSDRDLLDLFRPFGEVTSARVARARYSGRSRGFGFVEMMPEFGERAASAISGRKIDCVVLPVDQANN